MLLLENLLLQSVFSRCYASCVSTVAALMRRSSSTVWLGRGSESRIICRICAVSAAFLFCASDLFARFIFLLRLILF